MMALMKSSQINKFDGSLLGVCKLLTYYKVFLVIAIFLFVIAFLSKDNKLRKRTGIKINLDQKNERSGKMYIDRKNHLLYCSVPKIGSTLMKRIFLIISNKVNKSSYIEIKTNQAHENELETVAVNERNAVVLKNSFADFYKVLVVRNPYERLYSAYLDKFLRPNALYYKLGKKIIKMFRSKPTQHSLSCGDDVTFPEFIKYFIFSLRTGHLSDEHFIPIYQLCQPSNFDYKVIRLENISIELPKFLHSLGIHYVSPKGYIKNTRLYDEAKHIVYLFKKNSSKIKKCVPPIEVLRRLWKRDQIRGFIKMNYSFPLKGKTLSSQPEPQIFQMFFSYYKMSHLKDQRTVYQYEMFKAFSQLSPRDFHLTQQYLDTDCKLFGYEHLRMKK
ncbi:carbohydrate sulfotransferase 11-like [Argonauta hians]